jgi:predicted HTH transcriptional regulator
VTALEEALAFVKRNTRQGLAVRGLQHSETCDYPPVALREAVINALVHADYAQRGLPLRLALYEDRIEVENPGGLPPGLTFEDIRRGFSKLRNRVVGRVFHELKLIEQWGSGIRRMTTACVQAGLAEPDFEEIGTGFRVTFRRERVAPPQLDEVNAAVEEFVQRRPGVSTREIAGHIGLTTRATRGRLKQLAALGLVIPIGTGPSDPRRRFYPPAKRTG